MDEEGVADRTMEMASQSGNNNIYQERFYNRIDHASDTDSVSATMSVSFNISKATP
jgi:hypothetical protein